LDEVKAFVRSDNHELTMLPLPLADAIRELVSFLRFDSQIDCSRLSVEIAAQPIVRGNRTKIQQVLANLIKNAAFAIRGKIDGQIRVVLSVNEEVALLVVEDNGHGISAEIKQRIWEPFFTTKGAEGTGLGLDICRDLVRRHQGEIWCESEPGQGSRFTVRLPQFTSAIDEKSPRLMRTNAAAPVLPIPTRVVQNSCSAEA
jgi:signal transduction histidine kinase